jgi:hypothetical protein
MAEWIPPGGALLWRSAPGWRTASAANPDGVSARPANVPKTANLAAPQAAARCLVASGYRIPCGQSGPEAEQDEKDSHTGAKRQVLRPGTSTAKGTEEQTKARDTEEPTFLRISVHLCSSAPRPSVPAPREKGGPENTEPPFPSLQREGPSRGPSRRSPRPCSWALPRTARSACCTRRGPATWSAAWCCSRTSRTAAPWR